VDGAGVVTELFNIDDYPPGSTPSPSGMALRGQSLYWTDILSDVILHGAADGSGSPTALYGSGDYPGSPSSISPYGMQIEGEFLYWTDSTTDQILTAPIDGSGPVSVLYDSGDYPGPPSSSYAMRGIAIVPAAVPEPGGMSLLALGGILVVRVGRRRRDATVGRGSDAF
jgi:hypothetical protein